MTAETQQLSQRTCTLFPSVDHPRNNSTLFMFLGQPLLLALWRLFLRGFSKSVGACLLHPVPSVWTNKWEYICHYLAAFICEASHTHCLFNCIQASSFLPKLYDQLILPNNECLINNFHSNARFWALSTKTVETWAFKLRQCLSMAIDWVLNSSKDGVLSDFTSTNKHFSSHVWCNQCDKALDHVSTVILM